MKSKYGVNVFSESPELRLKSLNTYRKTQYSKLLKNDYIEPLFTLDEFLKNGFNASYRWRCKKCGEIIESCKNSSWQKQGPNKAAVRCEKCYPYNMSGTSHQERSLYDYLSSILDKKQIVYKSVKNWQIISPYELDIYLPNYSLAIEYDGLF